MMENLKCPTTVLYLLINLEVQIERAFGIIRKLYYFKREFYNFIASTLQGSRRLP